MFKVRRMAATRAIEAMIVVFREITAD